MGDNSAAIRRFVAGGISGAVAKTVTAPLEAIKLKLQYTEDDDEGALDCAARILEREAGAGSTLAQPANVLRYFPTQAFNFAFKDKIKRLMPKVDARSTPGGSREHCLGIDGRRLAGARLPARHRPHATLFVRHDGMQHANISSSSETGTRRAKDLRSNRLIRRHHPVPRRSGS